MEPMAQPQLLLTATKSKDQQRTSYLSSPGEHESVAFSPLHQSAAFVDPRPAVRVVQKHEVFVLQSNQPEHPCISLCTK